MISQSTPVSSIRLALPRGGIGPPPVLAGPANEGARRGAACSPSAGRAQPATRGPGVLSLAVRVPGLLRRYVARGSATGAVAPAPRPPPSDGQAIRGRRGS